MLRPFLCLFFASVLSCLADPVSRELPEVYGKEIQPLLTEAEPLLKPAPDRQAADRGGEVLLREEIVRVDGQGGRVHVTHNVYRAVAESGVNPISRDVEPFNKKRTRIHLALARTIQPDGRSLPVRGEAAFIQTPQRSADSDIYNDQGELVLIYPDVKPGSATESIVVEETESRIPGEFTMLQGFSAGWPVKLDRLVLEMPRGLAERVRLTTLGSGVPEPKREELDGGARVRWTWERRDIPGVRREADRVGTEQTGPAVFISTLPDWESFMRWYLPFAEKSMELSEGLKGKIDDWTKDAKSPAEITAVLLRKVASEVRYVGLEFGSGDLVPRPADAVWDNQYGDCKDKACLLTAMLRHKGITAFPALINTSFPGRIERRSPDYRHFDHCITAVAGPEGKWIFCDPTIPGLAPGEIGPADGDREVLLVKSGAEWARTPAHDFGTVRHRIEARMDAAGELSGWVTIEAEGYNAARYAELERKSTPESLRDSLQSSLSRMAGGITAVDVKLHPQPAVPAEGMPPSWQVETYILVPGSGAGSVPFLADSAYVPQTGNETERETALASWREIYESEARIILPPGLVPAALPEPLQYAGVHADASGSWEWKDGVLVSKFRFHSKTDSVAPADFPAFAARMRMVNAWISRPLPLKKGTASGDGAPLMAAPADPIEALPRLPSVEGQLLLIENKYPDGANASLRRAALEKSIRYFPGNQEMLHRAGTLLAWLDIQGGDPAGALRRLDGFQASCRAHVNAEEAALGDYFRAMALGRTDQREEALALFAKLSADGELSAFRRTWCFFHRARLLEEKEPDKALPLLLEGMALQDPMAESGLHAPWARLLLKAGRAAEITEGLRKLITGRAEAAPAILTRMAQVAKTIPEEKRGEYLKILTDLGPPASFGQEYAEALAEASQAADLQVLGTAIRTRLAEFLKAHPDSSATASLPEGVKTPEEMTAAFEKMLKDGIKDYEAAVRLTMEATLQSVPDADLNGVLFNLIRAANIRDNAAEDKTGTGPLLDEALALGEMLPKSSDTHYEALYARLGVLKRRNQPEEMRKLAEAMISEAGEGRDWIAVAPLRLLLSDAADTGNRPEVLRLCAALRKYPDSGFVPDAIFQEAVVRILDGQYDQAFTALEELGGKSEKQLEDMVYHDQAVSLLKRVKADRAAAVKWWRDSAVWWPAVTAALKKVDTGAKPGMLPLMASADQSGRTAAAAVAKKDFGPMAEHLLRLAGAGRLDAAFLTAYASLASQSESMGFGFAAAEMNDSLTAIGDAIPDDPGTSTLLALAEEAWYQKSDWAKTAATARRYFSLKMDLTAQAGYAARYWGVAAEQLKRDYPEASAALQKILDAKADEKERPRNLWLYGLLLNLDGKREAAVKLLRAELDGGQLDAGHPMMPQLRLFLEQNQAAAPWTKAEITAMGAAADRWLQVVKPAWFDWMFPASLEEPEVARDAAGFLEKSRRTRPAAALKAAILILRDPAQPVPVRQAAISAFLGEAPEMSADPARRTVEWNALFTTPGMPEKDRADALASALLTCAAYDWPLTFKRWIGHPLLARASPDYAPMLKRRREMVSEGLGDPSRLKAQALAVLTAGPDSNALRDFYIMFRHLTDRDTAAADEVLKVFRKTAFEGETGSFADGLKVDLARYLTSARDMEPIHTALSAVVPACFKDQVPPPSDADLLAAEQNTALFNGTNAARLSVLLKMIADRRFHHAGLDFWEKLVSCLDAAKPPDIRLIIGRTAVKAAASDEAGAAAVSLAFQCFDLDDPDQRQSLRELLKPLASKSEWTSTADWLTYLEAATALRTGAATDARSAIGAINDGFMKARLLRQQINTFIAADQRVNLKKLMEDTPSQTLLQPICLNASIAAWRLLDMKDEVELGTARLETNARQRLETAWPSRDGSILVSLLYGNLQTGDPSLIPDGLEEDLARWVAEPTELSSARFYASALRQDWETCARLSVEELKHRPAEYFLYFFAGKALAKQGQTAEAVRLLTVYLEKTHNETQVPEAKALLKSLQP
ncbi:MAG: DUF3857 and transglutaminase domain-containing protein [Verrucomicrobiota bacterium]